jgi:hypothetical protein
VLLIGYASDFDLVLDVDLDLAVVSLGSGARYLPLKRAKVGDASGGC